jgi:iron(III) transport system ATP-binding protein
VLQVRGLFKEYRNEHGQTIRAAQNISFDVPAGEMFTLLGPSGCGKTTTLRSIAGLEKPSAGEISVDGRIVFSGEKQIFVPPNRRGFGMVFQSYAIWPHMSVFENAAFPLQVGRKHARAWIHERVMRVLSVVALDGLESREATKLSGGQQQRLALARALVSEPKLLLLDEPLSNLDAKLRERMRFELKRLQRELGLTTIYVTHDQSEALALSHQVAVMDQGRIVQIGRPEEIYRRPGTRFIAEFVGTMNFLDGRVAERSDRDDCYKVATPCGELFVRSQAALSRGAATTISIRPENIHVSHARPDASNVWQGTVDTRVFLGDFQDLQIKVEGGILQARVHPTLEVESGSPVFLRIEPEHCLALADAEASLAASRLPTA